MKHNKNILGIHIDDVRIYDVALTEPEIAAFYLEWKEGAMD